MIETDRFTESVSVLRILVIVKCQFIWIHRQPPPPISPKLMWIREYNNGFLGNSQGCIGGGAGFSEGVHTERASARGIQ